MYFSNSCCFVFGSWASQSEEVFWDIGMFNESFIHIFSCLDIMCEDKELILISELADRVVYNSAFPFSCSHMYDSLIMCEDLLDLVSLFICESPIKESLSSIAVVKEVRFIECVIVSCFSFEVESKHFRELLHLVGYRQCHFVILKLVVLNLSHLSLSRYFVKAIVLSIA